jgi:hypothetical protein
LLFFRARPSFTRMKTLPVNQEKLFAQVIKAALPEVRKLWEDGDDFLPPNKEDIHCPEEIVFRPEVGRSYYQCQPHLWQCYWQGGLKTNPSLEVKISGETFHIVATAHAPAAPALSERARFIELTKRQGVGLNQSYGYVVELEVKEIPGQSQTVFLGDSCRDTYLPQRIYGYGKVEDRKSEGFLWDNFNRHIFIDKFYVSNQQYNDYLIATKSLIPIVKDRKLWPEPAAVSAENQKAYCQFFGKRVLEAKLFDAATMTPTDAKNPFPERVIRPATPWQRDLSKTFLGMSRINPDYQLSPLDCQLAQVKGCAPKFFTTDSATWMGMNFALGFFPEHLPNSIEPNKNLKVSSRFEVASSPWHELGRRSSWNGSQDAEKPMTAFRCSEEIIP